jgi:hypothetical protein
MTKTTIGTVSGIAGLFVVGALYLARPARPLTFTAKVPEVICGQYWTATFYAQGGTPPYSWKIIEGNIPNWSTLTFDLKGYFAQIKGKAPAPDLSGNCDGKLIVAKLRSDLGIK